MIKLEKWFDNTSTDGLPFLLEAAGRCPPDDVGGAHGYADYTSMPSATLPIQSMRICASGVPAVRSQRRRSEGARGRRQRILRKV
ncbi:MULTISPECIES: IS1096 element passenger TnpR family protein [Bradyrhizobium]|uniref:IS1096 element passenger TnpR family protein n=1 Tax=Bradyrhizobium pachyrhizi TaxID=280333 RepID=UPI002AA5303E